MFAAVILLIGAAGFLMQWAVTGRQWSAGKRLELAARWWFAAVGMWLLISGLGHVLIPDEIAKSIGWPPGSPFQREVGFADIAWGVLGLTCVRARGSIREGWAIGTTIFLWGAAGGHVYEMLAHGNSAPNNSGAMLYVDLLVPVLSAMVLGKLRLTASPIREEPLSHTSVSVAD